MIKKLAQTSVQSADLPPNYRAAKPDDSAQISALYDEEYRTDGGDAYDHYPFPQFLDPSWVASAVTRDDISWIVAELDGTVVGSAGAMRNIGSPADRVAEVFGIVVSRAARGRGIGAGLLDFLYETLESASQVILCEARTGDVRGWKVARHSGFCPIGFAPFAHRTPVGSESMLLTSQLLDSSDLERAAFLATNAALELAAAVDQSCESQSRESRRAAVPVRTMRSSLPPWPADLAESRVQIGRDDRLGAEFIAQWHERYRHRSGVIDFDRIEGNDPRGRGRYDLRYYTLCIDQTVMACERIIWDRTDDRIRIMNLPCLVEGARDRMLQELVKTLTAESDPPPVIVIDIRADAPELQTTLESLGFVPTAYYPRLIADAGNGRIDGLQYTFLRGRRLSDSLRCLDDLDWPAARDLISTFVRVAHRNSPSAKAVGA